jgi:hypothetical protein
MLLPEINRLTTEAARDAFTAGDLGLGDTAAEVQSLEEDDEDEDE